MCQFTTGCRKSRRVSRWPVSQGITSDTRDAHYTWRPAEVECGRLSGPVARSSGRRVREYVDDRQVTGDLTEHGASYHRGVCMRVRQATRALSRRLWG